MSILAPPGASNVITIGIQGPPGPVAASVLNPAALTALATTGFLPGTIVNLQQDQNGNALHAANFALDPTSVATVDNYFYIAAQGGGNWVRTATAVLVTEPQPQTTIYVDPKNSGGSGVPSSNTASDGNDGTSIARALLHFNQQARRWGGYSPRNQQNTTITVLSSQPDNSDPMIFKPIIEGGWLRVQGAFGAETQIATGTLSGTAARVLTAGSTSLLSSTLTSGLSAGQFIVNTSKSNSLGILHRNLGGNAWSISQTFNPSTLPPPFNPSELNTWGDGDSFVVYAPVLINCGTADPVQSIGDPAEDYMLQFYRIGIKDPTGNLFEQVVVNIGVSFVECAINRAATIPAPQAALGAFFYNCFLRDGMLGGTAMGRHSTFGPKVWGGILGSPSSPLSFNHLVGATLQGDVIISSSNAGIQPNECGSCRIGSIYLDSNDTGHAAVTAIGTILFLGLGFEPLRVWGPGLFDTIGQSRLSYPSGAGAAVAAFLNTAGIKLNTKTSACFDYASNAGARTTGNAINPGNMDTLMGTSVTDGALYIPGGSSIANDAGTF